MFHRAIARNPAANRPVSPARPDSRSKHMQTAKNCPTVGHLSALQKQANNAPTVQRQIKIQGDARKFETKGGKATRDLIEEIMPQSYNLARGWINGVYKMAGDTQSDGSPIVHNYASVSDLIVALQGLYPKVETAGPYDRPNFSSAAYFLAKVVASLNRGQDLMGLALGDNDLALPHRMSFRDIRESTRRFVEGTETQGDLTRWTDRLIQATLDRIAMSTDRFSQIAARLSAIGPSAPEAIGLGNIMAHESDYLAKAQASVAFASQSRAKLTVAVAGQNDAAKTAALKIFLKAFNEIHGNIPDVGQHVAINIPVSSAGHAHFLASATANAAPPPSPGTKALLAQSPHRIPDGIATTSDGKYIIGPQGQLMDKLDIGQSALDAIKSLGSKPTSVTRESRNQDSHKRSAEGRFDPSLAQEQKKQPAPPW
ncbi:hypothetical protein [Yoonia sp. I 8.24]|uniref:hypothetical protein n=1 Tax=Yoonia sp. I 8.24 TaxID=1537229 RepID=UPI001EE06FC8|nr:hypothetical protein [Yoonia sp. I 8.24]MCG3268895.1 hypothetical protein [Yoonia sp. I 8.24]